MVIFLVAAAGHMTILQINRRRGHKFLLSGVMFGFCMAREVALTMVCVDRNLPTVFADTCLQRVCWAFYPDDVQISIAAAIFVPIGVLLLDIVNLIFTQRILRATHPAIGWHKATSIIFKVLFALIAINLAIVISATVDNFFVRLPSAHRVIRDLQITAVSYFVLVPFLPIPTVILCLLIPRKNKVERFGQGRLRTKIGLLLTSSTLLTLGAAIRGSVVFKNPRSVYDPAWYDDKAVFYIFNFTFETIVVYAYLIFRVDKRFHIPDGSNGAGDYTVTQNAGDVEHGGEGRSVSSADATRVNSEERGRALDEREKDMTLPQPATEPA
jgi:hypothetical protein